MVMCQCALNDTICSRSSTVRDNKLNHKTMYNSFPLLWWRHFLSSSLIRPGLLMERKLYPQHLTLAVMRSSTRVSLTIRPQRRRQLVFVTVHLSRQPASQYDRVRASCGVTVNLVMSVRRGNTRHDPRNCRLKLAKTLGFQTSLVSLTTTPPRLGRLVLVYTQDGREFQHAAWGGCCIMVNCTDNTGCERIRAPSDSGLHTWWWGIKYHRPAFDTCVNNWRTREQNKRASGW